LGRREEARTMDECRMCDIYSGEVRELEAENERLRHMLSACVVAHETGRYEPQRIAYEVALNWLRDNPSE
jgi:hypothetical protein